MPTLTYGPQKRTLEVEQEQSLQAIARKKPIGVLFGCRDAACGSCVIRVLANPQHLTPRTKREERLLESIEAHDDERLACQCKILGDVTIEASE
jgi:ferredoxin